MITQNEISSLNLSPTKKDFVQIWNELIEVASKITERWDPTSTNESDPGIVLLKVLAGIADKLNYNIDKNVLEAFMPTAAQMESMRKLCELVGYDIKYYQSAETKVRISYTGNTTDLSDTNDEKLPTPFGLQIPKFTTITNADKDITFVTTNIVPVNITNEIPWVEVSCIEGQVSQCESINENNLITLAQLDDEYRYYLPEIQIAENGIFVYNAAMSNGAYIDGMPWEQVSNLNTRSAETRVFKFGYDSFEGRPYLVFPEDVGSLIGDGLFIYYIRTSGLNGNISPRTLEVLEVPSGKDWENYSAELFEVVNVDATSNGANIENISSAYNNFKKTVGTFDTLVTCRDYMNKIYSLMDASNSPYVSNILVTDIRNDINNAITLCSCNEFGILYKETARTKTIGIESTTTASTITLNDEYIHNGEPRTKLLISTNTPVVTETEVPLIDHFDLLLYPFKTFTQVSSGTQDLVLPYNESFTYTEQANREIEASLADFKTCAHNLTSPAEGDVVAINNYLRLNALIATSMKVSDIEAEGILHNVKVALVNEFNLRNLDFGEEIPFDKILSVIENADSRIKAVSLQEPTVLTTYSVKVKTDSGAESKEYGIASTADRVYNVIYEDNTETKDTDEAGIAKDIYNKLVLRNILAGRASLFDYDETFIPNNSEKPYTITKDITTEFEAKLKKNNAIAKTIKAAIDKIPSDKTVSEHVLYDDSNEPIEGFNGGILTLKSLTPKTYTLYETYEPSFALENAPDSNIIDNINRVEAVCEIKGNSEGHFNGIKLDKNEVIKFRAPNLITTKTYPAYVYYHFEHNDATRSSGTNMSTGSVYGSFASAISLADFINQDKIGANNFFTKLWKDAGVDFSNEDYTFIAEQSDPDNPKIPNGGKLANIFNAAIAVEAEKPLYVLKDDAKKNADGYYDSDQYKVYADANENAVKLFIGINEFTRVLNEHFSRSNEDDEDTSVKFRYYPLTYHTSSIWSSCIKSLDTSLPTGDVLWQLSSTSSYPRGELVMNSGKKLVGLNGDSLAQGRVSELVYICTYRGSDPNYASIPENSEIELGPTDKLYIHYTPSSTNEDGETVNAKPVSIVYEGGVKTDSNGNKIDPIIIKPSGFTLMPSVDVVRSQGISWKKTSVDFNGVTKDLLALAPNEQIELRSIAKVVLDTPARFYKNFDNSELELGNINKVINYELKDGEYIFYTNQNAQEAAYYGSGSVITLTPGAYIPKATKKIEVSQILEKGLHIVPWSNTVLLNKENNKTVTITEYQYRTLVEGDTLKTLAVDTTDQSNLDTWKALGVADNTYTLGGHTQWIKCSQSQNTPITYIEAGAEASTELPKIILSSESSSEPTTAWEVCSLLELSTSPGYAQQLRAVESKDNNNKINNKINVYVNTETDTRLAYTIQPEITDITNGYESVSVKLSTIAQSASGKLEKLAKENKPSVQLKVFKEEPPSIIALDPDKDTITPISNSQMHSAEASTANINNYLTKLDISSELWRASETGEGKDPNAFKLNFMIPKDADVFGVFSIYLEVPVDKLNEASRQNIPAPGFRAFIDVPSEFGQNAISIFNNKDQWWSDGIDSERPNRFYLKAGLNCIKINKSCSLLIRSEEEAAGNILYDNMRLVKGKATNGINLKLLDPDATFNIMPEETNDQKQQKQKRAKELSEKILRSIAELDKKHDFYYNVPIENGLAIEFDNNINSFSNPHTLYDINNINNAFVVSKLDIEYLTRESEPGLKIAKSSRY